MCGIIGYTGNEDAVPHLLRGLSSLEYRGYDSAGVAFFEDNALHTIKTKGRIPTLKQKLQNEPRAGISRCGIGHTRWATHGAPSDINAHPHGTARVMIVHNGIIENYTQIRQHLEEKGYRFVSETDTEAAALLIDELYGECGDPLTAIRNAGRKLSGSYAIAAIFQGHPETVYAIRKDNPLIVAHGAAGSVLASDITAIRPYASSFTRLSDGDAAVLTPNDITFYNQSGKRIEKPAEQADWDVESAQKGGYPHFMLKEIHEQPQAVLKTVRPRITDGLADPQLRLSEEQLRALDKIHIVGCGTAMHAGMIGKVALEKLARIPVEVEIASEFRYQNPILNPNDLAIVISQSGETADTLAALRLAKSAGIYTFAIVNVAGSTIAREADDVFYTFAGPEIAVASTKAYAVQLCALYLIALKIARIRGTLSEHDAKKYAAELVNDVPRQIQKAMERESLYAKMADRYKDHSSMFFIGRGIDRAIAEEAALKIKEISYIHCEAYAAGELKHGTISLISDGVPVVAFANDRTLFEKTLSNIKEVRARGARVLLICREDFDVPPDIAQDILRVPALSDLFMPLPCAVVFQLFAYYCSVYLGNDVDKPRNLAKSVTVE